MCLELFDVDIAELYEAGSSIPFLLNRIVATMVLQDDSTALWNARQLSVVEDPFPVQVHCESIALEGDVKGIPFTDRIVGVHFGGCLLYTSDAADE